MSKKHHKRTRAQILAKRAQPIVEILVHRKVVDPRTGVMTYVPQPFKRVAGRSKYTPHFGAKQAAKISGEYYRERNEQLAA